MLREWFVPQLHVLGIDDGYWFQQDGVPPLFALAVREYINHIFPGRWIGRVSEAAPASLPWPPRSPDLTTCDNALWDIVKQKVSQNRYGTTEQLKEAVRTAFQSLTPQMLRNMNHRTWRRIILCAENNGAQTDVTDV
jgi:hypothetical protein